MTGFFEILLVSVTGLMTGNREIPSGTVVIS